MAFTFSHTETNNEIIRLRLKMHSTKSNFDLKYVSNLISVTSLKSGP